MMNNDLEHSDLSRRLPVLDARLSLAASLFPVCDYGADIGADHGKLSCFLLAHDKCKRMCVADISEDSLNKAKQLLSLHGVSHRADFSVADGLKALKQQAQAIALLGMGGKTASDILWQGRDKICRAALILSAHTDLMLLRKTLMQLNYHLDLEQVVQVRGRFYVCMRALPGYEAYNERQLTLGPRLLETESTDQSGLRKAYEQYLDKEIKYLSQTRTDAGRQELEWLKEERERVRDCKND